MAQSREDRVIEAATGGALGGAVAGYLGSPFDFGGLLDKLLLGAGIGVGAALVFLVILLVVIKESWREVLGAALWMVPGCAGLCALVMGYKELLDWAFGWTLTSWVVGWRAAVLGGLVGAILFGGGTHLMSRPRRFPLASSKDATPGT
jgi:hypothetical protein